MDFKDVKEALPFAFDPNTREAFFSGFMIALTIGFAAGFISCRFLYLMIRGAWIVFRDERSARRAERERKERECQENRKRFAELRRTQRAEQEKADADAMELKRRKEADEAERLAMENAMSGIHRNSQRLLVDGAGKIYCPQCMKKAVRSTATQNSIGDIYCPRCGWNCPVYFTQIIR